MQISVFFAILLALTVQAIRIIQSNDDGWAESYARVFFEALVNNGHDVILSAPAEDKSGTASMNKKPRHRDDPCHYDSCPADSGRTGFNETSPELNWVNSYPASAMKWGIEVVAPDLWDNQAPELAVSGINVGHNMFPGAPFSGTIGAATHAAQKHRIPAIAFSADSDEWLPYSAAPTKASKVYAELAVRLVNELIKGGKPYVPPETFITVNFPKLSHRCREAKDFKFVFARINPDWWPLNFDDIMICGTIQLPTERAVLGNDNGCFVSVCAGESDDKSTSDAAEQAIVAEKLLGILSCLDPYLKPSHPATW